MIVKNKLSSEELEDVNGGVIVELTNWWYRVCYDEDGSIIDNVGSLAEAKKLAREKGVSEEWLYKEDFYNRYPDSWAKNNRPWEKQ